MATRTLKIGLSATDKQNMAQDVYDRLIDTVFEDYSSSSTYNVGDYAVYNNVLYRCVTAIVTPEAWNSSKWEVATFQDLVDDVNDAVQSVNNKANVDGNYPTMTVGNADNANNLIATKGLEVESYFTFEKTGGEQASAIESGNGTLKNLYGKTEKSENLLVLEDVAETTNLGITYTLTNGIFKLNGEPSRQNNAFYSSEISIDKGTYYFKSFGSIINGNSNAKPRIRIFTSESQYRDIYDGIVEYDDSIIRIYLIFQFDYLQGVSLSGTIAPMLVKGTTAPTTWSQGYTGLKHTHINGLKSSGINQWDEEWELGLYDSSTGEKFSNSSYVRSANAIKVSPNEVIYLKAPYQLAVFQYDVNGVYLGTRQFAYNTTITIPSDCHYIRFFVNSTSYGTTYNHDICINFSNPNINGNYYPYEQDTLDIDFEGNEWDYVDVEEKKRYEDSLVVNLEDYSWTYNETYHFWQTNGISGYSPSPSSVVGSIVSEKYEAKTWNDVVANTSLNTIAVGSTSNDRVIVYNGSSTETPSGECVFKLAEPIVTDVEIPKDTIKVWNGGSMEALGTEIPVGTKIFYQKNIKAFTEAFGEAIDWNPERIKRLAKLSITPEYVNISLNPSQANAYAVAQVYNATFTIVISTALTGTADSSITFQDSEIDLSSFETQPAESIYDMDGKKVSEEPTTEDCNIASFVGRSYNGIVLWSLLHSGVNKVKVHFEQAVPLDSEGNGKLDCRASLIL